MRCFMKALRSYADFEGRAGLREFWSFFIVWLLLGGLAWWLDASFPQYTYNFRNGLGIFELAWFVSLLLPWLAVSVRRLHDSDRSGWWVLAAAVPVIYLILMLLPGTKGENRFGRPQPAWC